MATSRRKNRSGRALKSYDLAVIGGGSGGVRAARIAASFGAKVVLAEQSRIGGTCVIRGCVPKKLLVYAARLGMDLEDSFGFGWRHDGASFHWSGLIENVNRQIARLESAYRKNLLDCGVTLVSSRAELLGAGLVKYCSTGEVIRADHILIATGATPVRDANLPGWELCATSDEVFSWAGQPRRVVVQGAGYIALEFASLLGALGSDVTVVLRSATILRGFDQDVSAHLESEMQAAGICFKSERSLKRVVGAGSDLSVVLSDGSQHATDAVVRALGRQPNIQGLGLENAGVSLNARGAIDVDESFRTSARGVYAVGDVANPVQLTPVAIREGHVFAESVFGGVSGASSSTVIPTAVFTTPEVGVVGMSEEEALSSHREVDIYICKFRPMKGSLSGRTGKVLFKLVVHRSDGRVLGAHLIGPEAAEMIQVLSVAINMGVRKGDLDRTLPLHPTLAEELLTMRAPARRHGISEIAA